MSIPGEAIGSIVTVKVTGRQVGCGGRFYPERAWCLRGVALTFPGNGKSLWRKEKCLEPEFSRKLPGFHERTVGARAGAAPRSAVGG